MVKTFLGMQCTDNLLSLEMRASVGLIATAAGFGFEPKPNVIYPVRPVRAPIAVALVEVVTGSGVVMSVAVIEGIEKMAYSVGEYAKYTVSGFMNEIIRAE